MSKLIWKPGNMLYPLPAVLVTCGELNVNHNILTISWAGTICTEPAMVSISIRPERHSYEIIRQSKEFVINLTTESMVKAVDYCGVKSGKDVNKFADTKLTPIPATKVKAPMIAESPVNIECKLVEIKKLGSHDLFIAKVVAVHVDDQYMDAKNSFHLNKAKPMCYSHGKYFGLGRELGTFGYSVKRGKKRS